MVVDLVAFEAAPPGADTGLIDSGVGCISVHVDIITMEEVVGFLFAAQVESHQAIQLVRFRTTGKAHFMDRHSVFGNALCT